MGRSVIKGPVGGERRPRRPRGVRVTINTWAAINIIRSVEKLDSTDGTHYGLKELVKELKQHLAPWFPEYNG